MIQQYRILLKLYFLLQQYKLVVRFFEQLIKTMCINKDCKMYFLMNLFHYFTANSFKLRFVELSNKNEFLDFVIDSFCKIPCQIDFLEVSNFIGYIINNPIYAGILANNT